jgi:hypothetical protein
METGIFAIFDRVCAWLNPIPPEIKTISFPEELFLKLILGRLNPSCRAVCKKFNVNYPLSPHNKIKIACAEKILSEISIRMRDFSKCYKNVVPLNEWYPDYDNLRSKLTVHCAIQESTIYVEVNPDPLINFQNAFWDLVHVKITSGNTIIRDGQSSPNWSLRTKYGVVYIANIEITVETGTGIFSDNYESKLQKKVEEIVTKHLDAINSRFLLGYRETLCIIKPRNELTHTSNWQPVYDYGGMAGM